MNRASPLIFLLSVLATTAASASTALRIPLGFDVFYEFEGTTGGGVKASRDSIVQAKVIPARDGRETIYVKATSIGTVTLRSKIKTGPTLEVQVVRATENEFAEFVTREISAGRVLEPLPLIVGEPASVVHEDEVGTVIVSDEMRVQVTKNKLKKGRAEVRAKALAPGWATVTIFDKKAQIARRFAFHLQGQTKNEPAVVATIGPTVAGPTPAATAVAPAPTPTELPPLPPTFTPYSGEPGAPGGVVDPPRNAMMVLPLNVGAIVPFSSTIPAIVVEPKGYLDYRRLLLPEGRQGLHIIARARGVAHLRVTDGHGATRHDFEIRGVEPEATALGRRCEEERREGRLCEAVRVQVNELKIVEIPAAIGLVVVTGEDLLRYARRRAGSEEPRELSMQALRPGVTDLNIFDTHGVLRRRMLIKAEGGPPDMNPRLPPPSSGGLPVPK